MADGNSSDNVGVSLDSLLVADPAQVYGRMDTETRNLYKNAVMRFSREYMTPPECVVKQALSLAKKGFDTSLQPERCLRGHIGYYLCDEGISSLRESLMSAVQRQPTSVKSNTWLVSKLIWTQYACSCVFAVTLVLIVSPTGSYLRELYMFVALVIFMAGTFRNLLIMRWASKIVPTRLPALDHTYCMSECKHIAVAIPCLLSDEEDLGKLIKQTITAIDQARKLRMQWILVADLPDTSALPDEVEESRITCRFERLVCDANLALEAMGIQPCLTMLYRRREFRSRQSVWMGWERKRGKLEQLCRYLHTKDLGPFAVYGPSDNAVVRRKVTHILFIDEDAQVPASSVIGLFGAMLHPLNKARVDVDTLKVWRGFGIIQGSPRFSVDSAARWRFPEQIFGGVGYPDDPQGSPSVSLNLFGEDMFIGKGLIDLETYNAVLADRLPEDVILSHDHIEGAYMKTATAGWCPMYEDAPLSLYSFGMQRHRWTRGDIQNASWLLGRVRRRNGMKEINPLSTFAKWQLAENIRAGLSSVAILVLLLISWSYPLRQCFEGTLIVVVILLFPSYYTQLPSVYVGVRKGLLSIPAACNQLVRLHLGVGLFLATMPYLAVISAHAALQASIRIITKRRTLDWRSTRLATKYRKVSESWLYSPWTVTCGGLIMLVAVIGIASPTKWPLIVPLLLSWTCFVPFVKWVQIKPVVAMQSSTHKSSKSSK